MKVFDTIRSAAWRASVEARSLVALARAGAIGLEPPRRQLAMAGAVRSYGQFGAMPRIAALRFGTRAAIVDEHGTLTFTELDEHVDRMANALRARGIAEGSAIGILCRNHRVPLIAAFAASRAGLTVVWLNTAFAARQAAEVAAREGITFLVYDDDLQDAVAEIHPAHGRVAAGHELDALIAAGAPGPAQAPRSHGRIVLLTSGTTGTPKGAPRPEPRSLSLGGALLQRMPMRAREATMIGPPLFHGTGLSLALLSLTVGSTLVLRRRFDAAQFLADSEHHRATAWCVVPIMLQRVLALGEGGVDARDLSSLRVVFCAGSQLPAEVAVQATAVLGDVIYNLYASTEVSIATLSTPEDVRLAPGSVGRPALGSRVKILDDHGADVAPGATGRIFVGGLAPFEGYTGGGSKEIIDGLMSTGDVGHFDADGRLHIDGRDDEMIVSGGENVFPREVEELLVTHPAIADAAAIGVEDAEFGQRLRAFVVRRPGAEVDGDAVRGFVKENLARYKVPRDVVFLDELPRNPTGKILKRELAPRAERA